MTTDTVRDEVGREGRGEQEKRRRMEHGPFESVVRRLPCEFTLGLHSDLDAVNIR